MNASKSIPFTLLVLLLSCNKKFDHSIPIESAPTSCELCSYADQISGQYRGYSHWHYNAFQDSLTVSIEHIFLNLGPYTDSTTMYFKRTKDFDTKPTRTDTVCIQTNSGNFNPAAMKIFNDSMIINERYYSTRYSVIVLNFKGKKIP